MKKFIIGNIAFALISFTSYSQNDTTNDDWETISGVTSTTTNVGIGTASPIGALHVVGDMRVGTGEFRVNTSNGFVGFGTNTPNRPMHFFLNNTSTQGQAKLEQAGTGDATFQFLTAGNFWSVGVDQSIGNVFAIQNNTSLNSGAYFAIKPGSGNVGIGTTNPQENFHVDGISRFDDDIQLGTLSIYDFATDRLGIGTTVPTQSIETTEAIRVGSTGSPTTGTIHYSGGEFFGYDGAWKPLHTVVDPTLTGLGTIADPVRIAPQGAGADDILKYNGVTWLPAALDINVFVNDAPVVNDTVVKIIDMNPGLGLEVVKANPAGSAAWFHTDDPGNGEPVIVVDHFFDGTAISANNLDGLSTATVIEATNAGIGHVIKAANPPGGGGSDVIAVENNGPAAGVGIAVPDVSGLGLEISIIDATNPDMAIKVTNGGLGSGARILNTNSANSVAGLYVEQKGTDNAAEFVVDNASNTAYALEAFVSAGSGDAVLAKNDGTGGAIRALNLDAGAPTVFIENTAADATTDVLEVIGKTSDDTYSGTYLFSVTNGTSSLNNAAFIGGNMRVAGDAFFDREITVAGDISAENIVIGVGFGITSQSGTIDTLFTDSLDATCIKTDKIQIGATPTPLDSGYIASVDGKLICEEVRVELSGSWPDFVFNKDYNLMPLLELKKSIETNNHLPGIPAADYVEKNGFELGVMNSKLLQKVEELTLYTIQQQEMILELQKRLIDLESANINR